MPLSGKDTQLEEIKECYSEILSNNKGKIQGWIDEVAKDDPAKALELMLKLGSYVIAKPRSIEVKAPFAEQPLFPDIEIDFTE